jgi:hypothetical protein
MALNCSVIIAAPLVVIAVANVVASVFQRAERHVVDRQHVLVRHWLMIAPSPRIVHVLP